MAGLGLYLWALTVVVSHCYIIISSLFGESPDEDSGHGGTTVQDDRASHCRCGVGMNVFYLLWVEYLQTCNARQTESVTLNVMAEELSCYFSCNGKISPNQLSIV